MAYFVVEVHASKDTIATLNDKLDQKIKDGGTSMNALMDYLNGLAGGAVSGTVQITVRDTTSSISTSGSGSTQVSYTLG